MQEDQLDGNLLLDLAADAIFIADAESGMIIKANQKTGQFIGIPVDEIINMHRSFI